MVKFICTKDFLITLFIFVVLLLIFGINNLANYVQVSQIFVWGFILHKMKVHHTLVKELLKDE